MTISATGSGLFQALTAGLSHIAGSAARISQGGVKGELALLRRQVEKIFGYAPFLVVQEYTNAAAAVTNAILLAKTPSDTTALVYTVSGSGVTGALDGSVAGAAMPFGRNATVTTTGADAQFSFPFDVTVVGVRNNSAVTEVITVTSGASPGIVVGAKIFDKITRVTIAAGAGAASSTGTVAVGFGSLLGLPAEAPLATRAGLVAVHREVSGGSVVTTGTFNTTNNSYLPAAAPDGSTDYCVTYEADGSTLTVPHNLGQQLKHDPLQGLPLLGIEGQAFVVLIHRLVLDSCKAGARASSVGN